MTGCRFSLVRPNGVSQEQQETGTQENDDDEEVVVSVIQVVST